MSTGTITPSPYQQEIGFDASSLFGPLNGALIYTYLAGTSTPVATYTTVNVSGGSAVANTNPIVADSAGRWTAFLTPGVSYKFRFCLPVSPIPPPSSPPTAYLVADNIAAVPVTAESLSVSGVLGESVVAGNVIYMSDGSGGKTQGRWYLGSSVNDYSSILHEVGFASADGSAAATIAIQQGGRVPGLSGLSSGSDYYVGLAGAITSTAPTFARFVGQADSATTLIASPNPPIKKLVVGQGGTGVATLAAHGVIVGGGTSAVVSLSTGTTGQILTSAGASADPLFASPTFQLLFAASGTDTSAGAATVSSFSLNGLTVKDILYVTYILESVTQNSTNVLLNSVTDSTNIVSVSGAAIVPAGSQVMGSALIQPRQGSSVNVVGLAQGMISTPARSDAIGIVTLATAWTAPWVLGLRYSGVTAGGTFKYVWNVYQLRGQ